MSYFGPYNVDRLRPFVTRGARLDGLDERTAQRTAETLDRMTLPMQQSANGTMSGPQVIYDAFRTPQMQANAIRSVAQRNRIPWSDSLLRTGIPGMAAPVGRSQHESGRAVDVLEPYVGAFKENMAPEMRQPLPGSDANHFELTRDAPNVGAAPSQGGPMVMGYRSGAQDMRNPYMPQQQPMSPYMAQPQENGFGQFVRQTVNSPLFLMGASVLGADNIGKGLMQGASAANTIAGQQAARERQQMLDAQNAAMLPLKQRALEAKVAQAERGGGVPSFGKQGAIFRDKDGRLYSIQFNDRGGRKIEPIDGLQQDRGVTMQDTGGEFVPVDKSTGEARGPTLRKDLTAADRAKDKLNFQTAVQPKAMAAIRGATREVENVQSAIDRALPLISAQTTGWRGYLGKYVPGSQAYNLVSLIDTIESKIVRDTMAEMRSLSAAGATGFGALSERELDLLRSSVQNLKTSQTEDQLRENLAIVRRHLSGLPDRMRSALSEEAKARGITIRFPGREDGRANPRLGYGAGLGSSGAPGRENIKSRYGQWGVE